MSTELTLIEFLLGCICMLLCLVAQAFFSGSEMGMIKEGETFIQLIPPPEESANE